MLCVRLLSVFLSICLPNDRTKHSHLRNPKPQTLKEKQRNRSLEDWEHLLRSLGRIEETGNGPLGLGFVTASGLGEQ